MGEMSSEDAKFVSDIDSSIQGSHDVNTSEMFMNQQKLDCDKPQVTQTHVETVNYDQYSDELCRHLSPELKSSQPPELKSSQPRQSVDEAVAKFLQEQVSQSAMTESEGHVADSQADDRCYSTQAGSSELSHQQIKSFSTSQQDPQHIDIQQDPQHIDIQQDPQHIDIQVQQTLDEDQWNNDFTQTPKLLTSFNLAVQVNSRDCFFKGCKWSPDGTCLLTCSDDKHLRLVNLPPEVCALQLQDVPPLQVAVKVKEAETIYDYCWLPSMTSMDASSCCFLSSSRDSPVHLWDAYSGQITATYKFYNHVDELTSAYSLALDPSSSKLYCGFNKMIAVYDVNRPGRQCQVRHTRKAKGRTLDEFSLAQAGIISCLAVNPVKPTIYAAGSYSRTVGVYVEPEGKLMLQIEGQHGGITHIAFSPDGNFLYVGSRKDNEILCWDIRQPDSVYCVLRRKVNTNQRIYFDIESMGEFVLSGNVDGTVSVWDMRSVQSSSPESEDELQPEPHLRFKAGDDCINGVSLHPTMPLIATTSGQRHFHTISDGTENSDDEMQENQTAENELKLWWCGRQDTLP